MSLRSRALLSGFGRGFFSANNQRRQQMQQRVQAMADDTATRDREHAKSEYDRNLKASQEEEAKYQSLKSNGYLDDDDNYTNTYLRDMTYNEWVKNGKGQSHEQFMETWKQGRPSSFSRQYKAPTELSNDLSMLYKSIDTKQQDAMSVPSLTGFDHMLARGVRNVTNMVGMDSNIPENLEEVQQAGIEEVTTSTPTGIKGTRDAVKPSATFEDKGLSYKRAVDTQDPLSLSKVLTDEAGNTKVVFAREGEEPELQDLGINTGPDNKAVKRELRSVNLKGSKGGAWLEGDFQQDKLTGEVLINGHWTKPHDRYSVIPSENRDRPFKLEYTSDTDGKIYEAQVIPTVLDDDDPSVVKIGGKAYIPVTNPVLRGGVQDETQRPEGIPKLVQNNLIEYSRNIKTAKLADKLLSQDYVGNPAQWMAANMSTLADALGAPLGLTGKDSSDIEAMVNFINNDMKDDAVAASEIGVLDVAAVQQGNVEAINQMLTFAVARMIHGSGKLNVDAVKRAEEVTSSLVTGSTAHAGKLISLINSAEDNMTQVFSEDLKLARGKGNSKIWEYYPHVKTMHVEHGYDFAADVADGLVLRKRIESLPEAALEKTKSNWAKVTGQSSFKYLDKPTRYSRQLKAPVMVYHKKLEDGSYDFIIQTIK